MKTYNSQLRNIIRTGQGKTYTVGLTTLLIIVLLIVLAILPAYKSISDQVKNNEAKQKYLDDLKLKRDDMDYLLMVYDDNIESIKFFDRYISSNHNDEFISANLEYLAKDHSLKLIRLDFPVEEQNSGRAQGTEVVPNAKFVPVNIGVEGNIEDIKNFVSTLERFPLLIKLETISYQNNFEIYENEAKDPSIFVVQIKASYYIYKY